MPDGDILGTPLPALWTISWFDSENISRKIRKIPSFSKAGDP
jgi:hypothetical protein